MSFDYTAKYFFKQGYISSENVFIVNWLNGELADCFQQFFALGFQFELSDDKLLLPAARIKHHRRFFKELFLPVPEQVRVEIVASGYLANGLFYFAVTFLPLKILFIFRMAHILPHMVHASLISEGASL